MLTPYILYILYFKTSQFHISNNNILKEQYLVYFCWDFWPVGFLLSLSLNKVATFSTISQKQHHLTGRKPDICCLGECKQRGTSSMAEMYCFLMCRKTWGLLGNWGHIMILWMDLVAERAGLIVLKLLLCWHSAGGSGNIHDLCGFIQQRGTGRKRKERSSVIFPAWWCLLCLPKGICMGLCS